MAQLQVEIEETDKGLAAFAVLPDGSRKKLNQQQLNEVIVGPVLQEQGVPTGLRLELKNFTNNPNEMRGALEENGYETRAFGGGWNFAVRKSPDEPWRVVDPSPSFNPLEFLRDAGDLISDVVIGGLATAGGTLGSGIGPGGTVAGAAAGSGLGETVRQGVGRALGVNEGFDPALIGLSTVAGGIAEPVGRLAQSGLRQGAQLAARGGQRVMGGTRELAGKIIPSMSEQPGLPLREQVQALQQSVRAGGGDTASGLARRSGQGLVGQRLQQQGRAAGPVQGRQGALVSQEEATDMLAKRIEMATGRLSPERRVLNEVLDASDRTVDMRKALAPIFRFRPERSVDNPEAQQQVRNYITRLKGFFQERGVLAENLDNLTDDQLIAQLRRVPARMADDLRQQIDAGAFESLTVRPSEFIKTLRDARTTLVTAVKRAVPEPVPAPLIDQANRVLKMNGERQIKHGARAGDLYEMVSEKMGILYGRRHPRRRVIVPGLRELVDSPDLVTNLFTSRGQFARTVLQDFDKAFGTRFMRLFGEANITLRQGVGKPTLIPRFTATGRFFGPSLAAGLAGPHVGFGEQGAIFSPAAAALGALSGSPRGLVAVLRGAEGLTGAPRAALAAGARAAPTGAQVGARTSLPQIIRNISDALRQEQESP